MKAKLICRTCGNEFECKRYQYRKDGKRYLPTFCSMECRKFENFTEDQKLQILRKSMEEMPEAPEITKQNLTRMM